MEHQDNENVLQLNDLSVLYEAIFFIFMTNKGECFNFCWTEILKGMYPNNSVELTMVNKDDQKKPADCQLMRTATICLSEDKRAILITQKSQNNKTKQIKTEQIFMHLDGKKIMVSKNVLQTRNIISDKGFIFKEEKFKTLPKDEECDFSEKEIINENDNNKQENINNNNNPNQQNQFGNMNDLFNLNNNNQGNIFNNNEIIFNNITNQYLRQNGFIDTNMNFNQDLYNNNNQNQFPGNIDTNLQYKKQEK